MSNKLLLQRLVDSKALSVTGRDWLKTAVDPFHDYCTNLEGMPDLASGLSRVQLRSTTATITSPDGNAYSARIWTSPIISAENHSLIKIGSMTGGSYDYAGAGFDINTINIDAWNGASNPNSSSSGATLARQALIPKADYSDGRLIALGFEVHNTTAEIYRSGVVTCSSLPNMNEHFSAHYENSNGGGANPYDQSFEDAWITMFPPTTSAGALTVPGTTQWSASQGNYCVARLHSPICPIRSQSKVAHALSTDGYISGITFASAHSNPVTIPVTPTGTVTAVRAVTITDPSTTHDFTLPYAIYEGLSAETSLVVTVRAYYEYFPNHDNTTLMPVCTPSPPFDPVAMTLYGVVAPHLPLAVPVCMNAKGDYFDMVMAKINQFAAPLLPLIATSQPIIASGLSGALGLANAVNNFRNQPNSLVKNNKNSKNKNKNKKKNKPAQVGWGTLAGNPRSRSS